MASISLENNPGPCRYFKAPGGCWYGKKCRYYHEGEDLDPTPAIRTKVCRYFRTLSGCRNGNDCNFVHVNDSGSDGEKCLNSSAGESDQSPDTSVANHSKESISDIDNRSLSNVCQSDNGQSDSISGTGQSGASSPDFDQSDSCSHSPGRIGKKAKGMKKKGNTGCLVELKPKEAYYCGECKQVFKGKDAYDDILRHHTEMLCKMEKTHMAFLGTSFWFNHAVACGACGKDFARSRDLLRHLVDKSKVVKQKKGQELHSVLLEEVARAFTDRDVGLTTESESQEELLIYLTNHVGSDQASDSDSDDSDVGIGMGLYMLSQVSRWQRTSPEDYEQELEERMANFGFTDGDVEELMCQGIMPWDDCAPAAMAALHGDYY